MTYASPASYLARSSFETASTARVPPAERLPTNSPIVTTNQRPNTGQRWRALQPATRAVHGGRFVLGRDGSETGIVAVRRPASSRRVLERRRKAPRCRPTPRLAEERGEQDPIDAIEIDGDPPEATDVGRLRERRRIELDQLCLRLEPGLDRHVVRPLAADREDPVADAERDVGLPGQPLLRLGQREGHPADVVERHGAT